MLVHVFEDLIPLHPKVCFDFLEAATEEEVEKASTMSGKLCVECASGTVRWKPAVLYKKLRDSPRKYTLPILVLLCQQYDTHEETSDLLRGLLEENGVEIEAVPFFVAEGRVRILTDSPTEPDCRKFVAGTEGKVTLKPRKEFAQALLNRLEEVAL
jgi:hypothetical protein